MEYNFRDIEKKWQQRWVANQTYRVTEDPEKKKFYVLNMFPYPSGAGLHVGHPLGYIEYKHDSIGKGIINKIGASLADEDAFYIAIFDVDKIDRPDMDAEKDGIMTAVYLDEVIRDYAVGGGKYGCAGLDGLTFAPLPGDEHGKKYLYKGRDFKFVASPNIIE